MRSCSSRQLAAALVRLGCYYEKSGNGSHRTFRRQLPNGDILRAPIVLGKREVKRGTVRSILRLLQISETDFDQALPLNRANSAPAIPKNRPGISRKSPAFPDL